MGLKSLISQVTTSSSLPLEKYQRVSGVASNTVNKSNRNIFATDPGSNYLQYDRLQNNVQIGPNGERSMIKVEDQLRSRQQINKDWRATLRVSELLSPFLAERLYYILGEGGYKNDAVGLSNQTNGLLRTLTETGGVVFPYTPSINVSQTVNYQEVDLTHTNLQIKSYSNTPPPNITVSAKFTANNQEEAKYLAAVIHFFRAIVKSDFGIRSYKLAQQDKNTRDLSRGTPGSPPPVLYFSAFGDLAFNEVPVLVETYSFDFPDDKDYIEVNLDGANMGNVATGGKTFNTVSTRVPTEMTINMNLVVQQSIERHQREFNLHKFKTGQMLRSNFADYTSSGSEADAYSSWRNAGGSGWTY